MRARPLQILLLLAGLALTAAVVYRLPPVNTRLAWRLDAGMAYVRGVINPVRGVPTPLPQPMSAPVVRTVVAPSATATSGTESGSDATATVQATPVPTFTPTPLPEMVLLDTPAWEKQDWNNCGPATLALNLRYYGWEGDQFSISDLLKPERSDRNVNVEELVYYVRNRAGWLNAEFRVGGEIETLKRFIAAGIPIIIEEGFDLDTTYWPNDDRWAGHYLLLTGYDDATQRFIAQDTFVGANREVDYETLDENWKTFNRVYIILYLPHQEDTVRSILGPHWDVEFNRQHALDSARAETAAEPQSAFAWFNLGTNLVYFEQYAEAARAYDTARTIGLPQRMLRYQFGPFFAYFHAGRNDDLLVLSEYALQRTPNSEEALLWHGWGLYRGGDRTGAVADFQAALGANPYYFDARYALDFVSANQ